MPEPLPPFPELMAELERQATELEKIAEQQAKHAAEKDWDADIENARSLPVSEPERLNLELLISLNQNQQQLGQNVTLLNQRIVGLEMAVAAIAHRFEREDDLDPPE